jgi:cytochrome c553
MRLPVRLALAAILNLCAAPAPAADKPARVGLCAACHGEDGRAVVPATPNLAGQNLDYLRSAVSQYRSGARDVPAMRAAVGMLTPAELERVLAWYAQVPATPATP